MQKKNKANLALGISVAGLLGTFGLEGFGAGLIHHGFMAATIGGLADWFAVTAIFHKPLGIKYRTDILRRNRARIMEAIVKFTSDDLLNPNNIMAVINKENTARLMTDYLEHRGGRERVQAIVAEVLLRAVEDMDTKAIAAELAPAVREGISSFALEEVLADVLRMMSEEKHSKRIVHSILTIGQKVLAAPAMQAVLLERIKRLREGYEGDSLGRAFILSTMGLSDERLLEILNDRLNNQLNKMLSGQTEGYASIKAGLETMLRVFSRDARLKEILRDKKDELLAKIDIEDMMSKWMEWNLKGENPFWLPQVAKFVDARIDDFISSKPMQRRFDCHVKEFLSDELNKHHGLIAGIINERLAEFSDDELVHFVEAKVQDDLQMIRINGAIVGSLVGMGLYLVVTLAERMWG